MFFSKNDTTYKLSAVFFVLLLFSTIDGENNSSSNICDSLKQKNFVASVENIKNYNNVNELCDDSQPASPAYLALIQFNDKESLTLLKLLVEKGADLNLRSGFFNCTPLDFIVSFMSNRIQNQFAESFSYLLRVSSLPSDLTSECSYSSWAHGDKPIKDSLPQDYLFAAINSNDISNIEYLFSRFSFRQIIERTYCDANPEGICKVLIYSPLVEAINGLTGEKGSSIEIINYLIDIGFTQNGYVKFKEKLIDLFDYIDNGKRTKNDKDKIKKLLLSKGFKKLPVCSNYKEMNQQLYETLILKKKSSDGSIEKSTSLKVDLLQVSKKAPQIASRADAEKYCENLIENDVSEWRLPTITELRMLIDNCSNTEIEGECEVTSSCTDKKKCESKKCLGCSFKKKQFSKVGDSDSFWSSSYRMDFPSHSWSVDFDDGSIKDYDEKTTLQTRCVYKKFINNKCPDSNKFCYKNSVLEWSDISEDEMNWKNAVSYCENMDGRLPTISELRGLIDVCSQTKTDGDCRVTDKCSSSDCFNLACVGCLYSGLGISSKLGDKECLWSLSVTKDNANKVWSVRYSKGSILISSKDEKNYVRCVKNY